MQQHCSKYFARKPPSPPPPPPPPPRGESGMQQHIRKYFSLKIPSIPGTGSVGQNSSLLENGHVAYQIIENQE